MSSSRCPAHCRDHHTVNRRDFLCRSVGVVAATRLLGGCASPRRSVNLSPLIRPCGPASKCVPKIKATFVRRHEAYGMWWPGAVYDGEAARQRYTAELAAAAHHLNVDVELRERPIFNIEEAQAWFDAAGRAGADGLLVIMLDRQRHAWPTAYAAADSGIPTVVFSPLGTSFTTNTDKLAHKAGCVVYSSDDFAQAVFGMKMVKAWTRMQRARCVVLKGDERRETKLMDLGTTMQYVPAANFLFEYKATPDTPEILAMADEYMRLARDRRGATRQDVVNGIKSYVVAARILEREKADAITMDCLGALGESKVSLPCIAWSRMNDDGIPAACEADWGAVAAHMIVQYLFDRPGFQQDPVADTLNDAIIGAHCSCPTHLNGFVSSAEPFELMHHHGNRDAVPRTLWREGQRITCIDVLLPDQAPTERSAMLISVGTVMDNISVPPAGGCVVSVRVKMDGGHNVLDFPGFHQLFFYGDYKKELMAFCQLFGLEARVV